MPWPDARTWARGWGPAPCRPRPDRHRDVGVIVEHGRALRSLAEHAPGKGRPVVGPIMWEGDTIGLFDIGGGGLPRRGVDRLTGIGGDAGQTGLVHLRTDVVQNGGGDHARPQGRDRHGDQPAHGGAQKHGALDTGLGHQGQNVLRIGRRLVGHGIGGPVRTAAPAHIDRQNATTALGQQGGDAVKVRRIAGQAMDGDDRQARLTVGPGIVAGIQIQPVLGGEAALGIGPGLGHGLGSDGWVFHPM